MRQFLINPLRQLYLFSRALVTEPHHRLTILSAIGLTLSFPPFPFGFLVFGALIPFLYAIRDMSWSDAFRQAFLLSTLFFTGLIYWIAPITLAGFLGTLLAMGVYIGTTTIFTVLLRDRLGWLGWLSFPFLFGAMEWLRSLGMMGFPWGNLGYALGSYNTMIQIVSITGMGALSFWILLVNTLGFLAWLRKSRLFALGSVLTLVIIAGILIGWGHSEKDRLRAQMDDDQTLQVALLQGNIDQDQKWSEEFLDMNFGIYRRLTEAAAQSSPDLIVWPETAATCYLTSPNRRPYLYEVLSVYSSVKIPLILGALDYEYIDPQNFKAYNAIFYIRSLDWRFDLPRYHKNRLVPFAEWIPLSDQFNFLKKLQFGQADFTPATHHDFFHHPKGRISSFICFEAVFPRYTRDLIRALPDHTGFMINVTNDAWFGRTSAPYQHAQMLTYRAIETRTGIGRSANTGISLICNPLGEMEEQTAIFREAWIRGKLHPTLEESLFVRYGDIFDQMVFYMSLGWLALILAVRRKAR